MWHSTFLSKHRVHHRKSAKTLWGTLSFSQETEYYIEHLTDRLTPNLSTCLSQCRSKRRTERLWQNVSPPVSHEPHRRDNRRDLLTHFPRERISNIRRLSSPMQTSATNRKTYQPSAAPIYSISTAGRLIIRCMISDIVIFRVLYTAKAHTAACITVGR